MNAHFHYLNVFLIYVST